MLNVMEAATAKTSKKILVVGIWEWKRPAFRQYFWEDEVYFSDWQASLGELQFLIRQCGIDSVMIWSFSDPKGLVPFLQEQGIAYQRVEDGFLRSKQLTGERSISLSLVVDDVGLYFNPEAPSRLENILNYWDFDRDPGLLQRAKKCMECLLAAGISKYNHVDQADSQRFFQQGAEHKAGGSGQQNILVVGQVEDDAAIRLGAFPDFSNYNLLCRVKELFPEERIFYKPHPDVLAGHRVQDRHWERFSKLCTVLREPMHIGTALCAVHHVVTATSLVGFEAIMRGVPVTTFGKAFYAGWGLTRDFWVPERRYRRLTKEQLFAAAYILYSKYFCPNSGTEIPIEDAFSYLQC